MTICLSMSIYIHDVSLNRFTTFQVLLSKIKNDAFYVLRLLPTREKIEIIFLVESMNFINHAFLKFNKDSKFKRNALIICFPIITA